MFDVERILRACHCERVSQKSSRKTIYKDVENGGCLNRSHHDAPQERRSIYTTGAAAHCIQRTHQTFPFRLNVLDNLVLKPLFNPAPALLTLRLSPLFPILGRVECIGLLPVVTPLAASSCITHLTSSTTASGLSRITWWPTPCTCVKRLCRLSWSCFFFIFSSPPPTCSASNVAAPVVRAGYPSSPSQPL